MAGFCLSVRSIASRPSASIALASASIAKVQLSSPALTVCAGRSICTICHVRPCTTASGSSIGSSPLRMQLPLEDRREGWRDDRFDPEFGESPDRVLAASTRSRNSAPASSNRVPMASRWLSTKAGSRTRAEASL